MALVYHRISYRMSVSLDFSGPQNPVPLVNTGGLCWLICLQCFVWATRKIYRCVSGDLVFLFFMQYPRLPRFAHSFASKVSLCFSPRKALLSFHWLSLLSLQQNGRSNRSFNKIRSIRTKPKLVLIIYILASLRASFLHSMTISTLNYNTGIHHLYCLHSCGID